MSHQPEAHAEAPAKPNAVGDSAVQNLHHDSVPTSMSEAKNISSANQSAKGDSAQSHLPPLSIGESSEGKGSSQAVDSGKNSAGDGSASPASSDSSGGGKGKNSADDVSAPSSASDAPGAGSGKDSGMDKPGDNPMPPGTSGAHGGKGGDGASPGADATPTNPGGDSSRPSPGGDATPPSPSGSADGRGDVGPANNPDSSKPGDSAAAGSRTTPSDSNGNVSWDIRQNYALRHSFASSFNSADGVKGDRSGGGTPPSAAPESKNDGPPPARKVGESPEAIHKRINEADAKLKQLSHYAPASIMK